MKFRNDRGASAQQQQMITRLEMETILEMFLIKQYRQCEELQLKVHINFELLKFQLFCNCFMTTHRLSAVL